MTEIKLFRIDELKANPESISTHQDFDPALQDSWLVEDIRKNGVLLPICVRPDKVISDGWRRWRASQHLGLKEIPGFESEDVFASAQLARQLTVFAKINLYRARLEELVQRGKDLRTENLSSHKLRGADPDNKRHQLEQDWVLVETVLDVNRQTLMRGLTLLADIEEQEKTDDKDTFDQAQKYRNVFRTRGIWATLRMRGETVEPNEESADCNQWEADSEPEPIPRAKRKQSPDAIKACVKEAPKAERATLKPPAWQPSLLSHLRDVRDAFDKHDILDAEATTAFGVLETKIEKPVLKLAA